MNEREIDEAYDEIANSIKCSKCGGTIDEVGGMTGCSRPSCLCCTKCSANIKDEKGNVFCCQECMEKVNASEHLVKGNYHVEISSGTNGCC
ncbi:MAG: hypothetical protein WCW87_00180 [Candidatus Paceibacterota bacterium]